MAINYKKCSNCGSTNVLGILYGMPTHDAFLKAEAGEIKLGGCCITDSDPEYYCKDCEHEWDKQQAIDYSYNQMELLIASVGGYFGGYYEVEINLKSRELTWKHFGGGNEESVCQGSAYNIAGVNPVWKGLAIHQYLVLG